jgi:hypothetical protein
MKTRRQIGARYLARARGAFSWARLVAGSNTGNSASFGCARRRGPDVAQHGQDLPNGTGEILSGLCSRNKKREFGVNLISGTRTGTS